MRDEWIEVPPGQPKSAPHQPLEPAPAVSPSPHPEQPFRPDLLIESLPQRLRRRLPIVMTGTLLLLIVAGGVLAVSQRGFHRLTEDNPVLAIDSALYIRLAASDGKPVRVNVQPLGPNSQARAAIPTFLEPIGDVYTIQAQGNGAADMLFYPPESATDLDLFAFNPKTGQWSPVEHDWYMEGAYFRTALIEGPVGLFRTHNPGLLLSTILEEGQALDAATAIALNSVYVPGALADDDGRIAAGGLPANLQQGTLATVLTVQLVPSQGGKTGEIMLASNQARRLHVDSLVELAQTEGYSGILLDYGPLDQAARDDLTRLVGQLAAALHGAGKTLAVRVAEPVPVAAGWDTGAYDWRAIGQAADTVIVPLPASPAEHNAKGLGGDLLAWSVQQIDRTRLYVSFSTLSVDEWAGSAHTTAFDYALDPLSEVRISPESLLATEDLSPGESVQFEVSGAAYHLARDRNGAYRYDIVTGDGRRRVWLMTGSALRRRLDWIATYQIGGIVLEDLLAEGNAPDVATAVEEFKVDRPSSLRRDFTLTWQVEDGGGSVLHSAEVPLGSPFIWSPEEEGQYVVSALLTDTDTSDNNAVAITVGGSGLGSISDSEGVVAGAPDVSTIQRYSRVLPADMPAPVVPPGALGNFELGGQVNHVIIHPDQMEASGMRWVKYQIAWAPDMGYDVARALVQQGHTEGFKVLLSITGQVKYPESIDFAAYLRFIEAAAYAGPDAIEVWNEQNIVFEWPRGQIDGGIYVRDMLAPAYNTIKSINPNIMVISGAPAPTGAFFAEGGCAVDGTGCDDWIYLQQMAEMGAANYMDCVGVHYNAGATSPYAVTGHPADPGYQHYSWYFGSMVQLYHGTFGHPVCFTELGYLSQEGYGGLSPRFGWAGETTVAQQAQWLAEAAQYSRELGNVRLLIVWNVDFIYWGDDPMAGYAIVRKDGNCPACSTLGAVMGR